jgi:periplasmic mercuric ion binding protein
MVIFLFLVAGTTFAQKSTKNEVIKIKTSAQCGMCKDRIETALAYEKGIVKSDLNVDTKVLTVTYKPLKINPEKIRVLVSKIGYDADNVPADKLAYSKLPACCKVPGKK